MPEMTKLILDELLDRYERSKLFREGSSTKRILIDVPGHGRFSGLQEKADEKKEFLDALEELQDRGLIGYDWVRFEKGNLVSKIWLVTEPEALSGSYRMAGRISRREKLFALERQIHDILDGMAGDPDNDLVRFLAREREAIQSKKTISRFFFQGDGKENTDEKNRNLLLFLRELQNREDNRLERILSTTLYGDSKYFERELKQKVLSILRDLAREDGRENLTDEELLEERGIFRWPEIMEFCGPVSATLDDGTTVPYMGQVYGAYINSAMVHHVVRVQLLEPLRIISIENKANYVWYLTHARKSRELVLYHGGCFSPMKGRWFRLIAEADGAADVEVRHWSDIDLGGFRIFRRFRDELFPRAVPWRMDVRTLENYMDYCIPLGSESYRHHLSALTEDPAYNCFSDTIRFMLDRNVRLEQEAEIGVKQNV